MIANKDINDAINGNDEFDKDKERGKTKRQVWFGGSVRREAWRRRGRNGKWMYG